MEKQVLENEDKIKDIKVSETVDASADQQEFDEDTSAEISKTRSAIRLAIAGLAVIVIAYVCVEMLPNIIAMLKSGDTNALIEYVQGQGFMGVFVLVALQVIQTITIFFPGIPIYMCSGIVFGKWWGFLICYITYVVINVAVFIFVRRMKEAAYALLGKKDDSGMGELMKKTKHPNYLVMALCVVPVVPNGMVPYIASPSKITLKQFIASVAIGCIPGIFLFVVCGDLLLTHFWAVIIFMVLAVGLVVVALIFKKQLLGLVNGIMDKFFGNKEEENQ